MMVQPRSKDKVILKTGTTPTKVYLAHPLSERGYGQHLEQRLGLLGLDVMNPFDYVGIIYDDDRIDIVQKDLDAMSLCELVIAFIPLPDNGVMGEIYHASQILNIPVIILTHSHDIWLRFCSDRIVRSEEDLITTLQSQLDFQRRVVDGS